MVGKVLLHVHIQFVLFVENSPFSIDESYVSLLQKTKSNNNKEQSKTKQQTFGHTHKACCECEMCLTGSDDCYLVLTSRPWVGRLWNPDEAEWNWRKWLSGNRPWEFYSQLYFLFRPCFLWGMQGGHSSSFLPPCFLQYNEIIFLISF